jgi:hypothetical protein
MDKFQELLQKLEHTVRDRRWGDYMNHTKFQNMMKDIGMKLKIFKTSQEMLSIKIEKSIKQHELQMSKQEDHMQSILLCIKKLSTKIEDMDMQFSHNLSNATNKRKKMTFFDDSSDENSNIDLLMEGSPVVFTEDDNATSTLNKKKQRKEPFITPEKSKIFEYFSDEDTLSNTNNLDFSALVGKTKKTSTSKDINTYKCETMVVKNPYKKTNTS